jgi:hypothetical protein
MHVEGQGACIWGSLSPATVAKHHRSLQQLFKWLTDDGEIARSPMERMSPPSVPEQPVPILDDAALSALLRARETPSRTVATPPSSDYSSTPACERASCAGCEWRTLISSIRLRWCSAKVGETVPAPLGRRQRMRCVAIYGFEAGMTRLSRRRSGSARRGA